MAFGDRARISVALCTFNGAKFLEDQLKTIDRQTRQPEEIVVADDGSTDDTPTLVRAWATARMDVRILPKGERLGVTRNFERAISACTGDLIALADQDDVWTDARLEIQEKAFVDNPELLLLHGDAELIDERGRPIGRSLLESLRVSAEDRGRIDGGDAFDVYLRRNLATGATTMFSRALLSGALPFPDWWVHDEWLAILAAAQERIRLTDDTLIRYRQHGQNQIGASDPGFFSRMRRIFEPRGLRNVTLAHRAAVLTARLDTLSESMSSEVLARAAGKARFEERRAVFSGGRLRRAPEVMREALRGDYSRYSSQGTLDIVRDLFQPS